MIALSAGLQSSSSHTSGACCPLDLSCSAGRGCHPASSLEEAQPDPLVNVQLASTEDEGGTRLTFSEGEYPCR